MATHDNSFNRDAFNQRLMQEFYDSYDEELELELDDLRFSEAAPTGSDEKAWRRRYFRELLQLQGELVKLQDWVMRTGHRLVILFEGRDAAGKGGVIKRITQRLNPRTCRVAALPAPNDREKTSGTFSVISRICPPRARWCCSTAAGTTGQAWSASWDFAVMPTWRSFIAACPSLKKC